jgi:hypothetical protein
MSWPLFISVSILLVLFSLIVVRGLRWGWQFLGDRLVTCPETKAPAAVRVDAAGAGIAAAFGEPHVWLRQCSRWPQRESCGQACLAQIRNAPEDCLVSHIVAEWYGKQRCVFCGRAIGPVHWHDHPPALLSAEGSTVAWNQVQLAELPRYFETHLPVCWNCHVAQSFVREHGDLVVHRPEH